MVTPEEARQGNPTPALTHRRVGRRGTVCPITNIYDNLTEAVWQTTVGFVQQCGLIGVGQGSTALGRRGDEGL